MYYFLQDDFWEHSYLVLPFILSLTLVIFLRYALVSVAYKYILERISKTRRNSWNTKRVQILREIKRSLYSSIVFTLLCAATLFIYQKGWTKIYEDVNQYALWYLPGSPLLVLIAYETYYYWLHRWMHTPSVFRVVHKIHHENREPTVFTAFSFHPLEGFLQFLFFPLVITILPIHIYSFFAIFILLTLTAMVNHSGVDIYGKGRFRRHIIGAAHHDLHHEEFTTNFGLHLTWWDSVMKTSSKRNRETLK